MTTFLINIMLALAWAALVGEFSEVNLVTGFILGYFALWVMRDDPMTTSYFLKVPQVLLLVVSFFWALLAANLRVAYSVLAPLNRMRPGIVAIPLDLKTDTGIIALADMITLTPGTLSIDVSSDKRVLYVHGMHIDDLEEFKRDIKDGFEQQVRRVFE